MSVCSPELAEVLGFYALEKAQDPLQMLDDRMRRLTEAVFKDASDQGIDCSRLDVVYNFKQVLPNPHVRQKGDRVVLEIPFLFLLEKQDFFKDACLGAYLKKKIDVMPLQESDFAVIKAFCKFIDQPDLANQAKKFVLHHEFAHILLNHLKHSSNSQESKLKEKQADLLGALTSKAVKGAIYLFEIFAQLEQTVSDTHPTYQERINYLQEFADSKEKMTR